MVNWRESMQQSFEYYTVDPGTWADVKQLNTIKSSSITRDKELETLGSATIDISESIEECYIRVYLITIQNGITEKHPLGTFLVQTPGSSFDGKIQSITTDAYTPLLELKENQPPIGYFIGEKENILKRAAMLTRNYLRAPVVETSNDTEINYDFVSNTSDTWLTFLKDWLAAANFTFDVDEMGRILFAPNQDTASLQPVWTYDDDNSSILYPDFEMDHDLYGIPNVVEVVHTTGLSCLYSRVVNDDPNSPISTIARGREIVHRVLEPDLVGNPTQRQVDEYAEQLLRELSSLEYTINYTHGYCPVRVGDCVRLNYTRAGLINVKAKVIKQTIKCEPGCPVSETAIFTKKLWR